MLDAHESLFSDVGDDSAIAYEGSAAIVSDMDTKNIHLCGVCCGGFF